MMNVIAGGQENHNQNLESSRRKFPTGALWSEGERTSWGPQALKGGDCVGVWSRADGVLRSLHPLQQVWPLGYSQGFPASALWLRQLNAIQGCCAGEGSKVT